MPSTRMCIIEFCPNRALETKDTCAGHVGGYTAVGPPPTAPRGALPVPVQEALKASTSLYMAPSALANVARDLRSLTTSLSMLTADLEHLVRSITPPEGFTLQLPKVIDGRPKAFKKAKAKSPASRLSRAARKARARRASSR